MDRLGRRVYNEGLSYNQRGEFHGDLFGEGPTPKPVQKPTAAPTIEPDAPCSVAGSRPFNGGTLHCVDIGEGQLVDVLRRRHAVLGLGVHLRQPLPVDGRRVPGRRRGRAGRVRLITVRACTSPTRTHQKPTPNPLPVSLPHSTFFPFPL